MNISKPLKNKRILFVCVIVAVLVASGMVGGVFVYSLWKGKNADENVLDVSTPPSASMYCGLFSLYLSLKMFSDVNPACETTFQELCRRFPDVEKKGMNLKQIQSVLVEKGIHTSFREIRKSQLREMSPKTVFFVLQQEEGKVPHIFFYCKETNSGMAMGENINKVSFDIQKVDHPNPVVDEPISTDDDTKIFGMFASLNKDLLPKEHFFKPLHLVSLACFLMALAVFLYSKKKDGEKAK